MQISQDRFATKTLQNAIGIETAAGTFTPLIDAGTELPTTFSDTFSTVRDEQASVRVALTSQTPVGEMSPLGTVELGVGKSPYPYSLGCPLYMWHGGGIKQCRWMHGTKMVQTGCSYGQNATTHI